MGSDERKGLEKSTPSPSDEGHVEPGNVMLDNGLRMELCREVLRFLLCVRFGLGQAEVQQVLPTG